MFTAYGMFYHRTPTNTICGIQEPTSKLTQEELAFFVLLEVHGKSVNEFVTNTARNGHRL